MSAHDPRDLTHLECEEAVIARIRQRRDAGRAKYGTTMERTDLSELDWIRLAQEESLDFAIYLQRLLREVADLPALRVLLRDARAHVDDPDIAARIDAFLEGTP